MEILIQNPKASPVKSQRIKNLAQQVLRAENCPEDTEVSILITDDEQMAELNEEYRGVEGPTDVLSFAQREGDEVGGGIGDNLLGDVVISLDTAQRQADQQDHPVEQEVDMLLVHGLLHLLGYDHADPAEEQEMFARQAALLEL